MRQLQEEQRKQLARQPNKYELMDVENQYLFTRLASLPPLKGAKHLKKMSEMLERKVLLEEELTGVDLGMVEDTKKKIMEELEMAANRSKWKKLNMRTNLKEEVRKGVMERVEKRIDENAENEVSSVTDSQDSGVQKPKPGVVQQGHRHIMRGKNLKNKIYYAPVSDQKTRIRRSKTSEKEEGNSSLQESEEALSKKVGGNKGEAEKRFKLREQTSFVVDFKTQSKLKCSDRCSGSWEKFRSKHKETDSR